MSSGEARFLCNIAFFGVNSRTYFGRGGGWDKMRMSSGKVRSNATRRGQKCYIFGRYA